jgi:glycerol-1-phosphate dehydrogenase [NAD(P)+]
MLCECGKEHKDIIESIRVEEKIIEGVLEDLKEYKTEEILFVTDLPVSKAYQLFIQELEAVGYSVFRLKRLDDLLPDEQGVGEIILQTTQATRLIVGIGSGTLNDLCRYVSYRLNIPYWIVMSAPSMDGYASTASPILVDGFKKTFYCHVAKRIYGQKDVINHAPSDMIVAGLGDLLGKITALTDWKVSHILHGEYFCPMIYRNLYAYIDNLSENLSISQEGLSYKTDTKQELGELICESLIQSGIYMHYVGNSRPASGAEHLISHTLEMKAIEEGKKVDFHGIKVGMATDYVLELYKDLHQNIDKVKKLYQLDSDQVNDLLMTIEKALEYEKVINDYQKLIPHIRKKYSKEQIVYAMKQGPVIRDRFTILSIYKKLGWENL